MRPRLIKFLGKCTPVSLHGWFLTDIGIKVRKPLNIRGWDMEEEIKNPSKMQTIKPIELTKWQKIWKTIKKWFK